MKTALVSMMLMVMPFVASSRDLLAEAADKIASAPSLSTRYEASDPTGKVTGEAVMAGKRFVIVTDAGDFETWFDGKTQWTYSEASGEVSMTEPTPAEIFEVNPLAIITDVKDRYRIKPLTSTDSAVSRFRLESVGDNPTVKSAVVTIDNRSGWPIEIQAVLSDSGTVSLRFSETTVGEKIAPERFRYNPAFHPDAEIIDLR